MRVLIKKEVQGKPVATMMHIYDEAADRALCGRLANRNSPGGNAWVLEERASEEVVGSDNLCYHCYERHVPEVRMPFRERLAMEKLEAWNRAVAAGSATQ